MFADNPKTAPTKLPKAPINNNFIHNIKNRIRGQYNHKVILPRMQEV